MNDSKGTGATNHERCRRLSWLAFLGALGFAIASLFLLVIGIKVMGAGHGTSSVWVIGLMFTVLFVISSVTSVVAGVTAALVGRARIAWWVFVDGIALLTVIILFVRPEALFRAVGL